MQFQEPIASMAPGTAIATETASGDRGLEHSLRLGAADFLIALAIFALFAGAFSVSSGNAFPAPPPLELLPASAVAAGAAVVPALTVPLPSFPSDGTPSALATILAALAFSSLVSLNMAVWRHLRTAYAPPQRNS